VGEAFTTERCARDDVVAALPAPRAVRAAASEAEPTSEELLTAVAQRGDEDAFAVLYDRLAGPIFGMAHQVLRNHSHAEEVTQEVMIELWRTATRYSAAKRKAASWALTMAHRRAIDRVRSEQAATARESKAMFEAGHDTPFDEVAESAEHREERARVQACLGRLTGLQRQSVTMAYYQGQTYTEVATSLGVAAGTIKTRMRDGLIRLRDCFGVAG
jgi:RNA polymerase sigma-70 factor (ECF subfamily)